MFGAELIIIPPLVIGIIIIFCCIKKETSNQENLYSSTKYRDLHHYKRNDLEIFIS